MLLETSPCYALLTKELAVKQFALKQRQEDLRHANARVTELQEAISRLETKISDIERDKKALDRGYIALMCDTAAKG